MSQQLGPDGKQSFLDRGTIVALILIGVFWFAWSSWVEKKYPSRPAVAAQEQTEEVATSGAVQGATASGAVIGGDKPAQASSGQAVGAKSLPEKQVRVETNEWVAFLSSHGLGLSTVDLKNYKTRDEQPILVGATAAGLFTTKLVGETAPIAFEIIEESGVSGSVSGAQSFKGLANLGAYKIEKTLSIATEGEAAGRAIKISTRAFGDLSKFPGFQLSLSDEIKAPVRASFFAPSYDHHDWFVSYEDTDKRVIVAPDKPEEVRFNTVRAAALSSHYFTAAIADNSSLRPTFHGLPVTPKGAGFEGVGYLEYKPMTRADEFKTEQTVYIGPKDVDALRAADRVLSSVIDYGMFAVIAEPLVWLLRLFHSWFGNWGFAIIGLTIVVRLLVLPFNIYSFKSMKVMQKIQPQMQAVRERFKDDPRRMNEEVMRLMKENKANPLGGCLPMLLQLPVFFALYQVLAMSIELYRQPFVFWIHDLTVKDPFFVLPILMGVSMFVQQKITPVADPQQAKILIWMPVIFSALMFTLPSGLTLYIFVSTLFGIVQQYVLMRDKAPATQNGQKTVHQAKA